jgi:hypothetical protein
MILTSVLRDIDILFYLSELLFCADCGTRRL